MSEQPTGDYRLVPWAYPPIPGGSSNSTAQAGPYDFSDIRAGYASTPQIGSTDLGGTIATTSYFSSIRIIIRDFVLNDSSNVSQILWKFTPTGFVDSAGTTITGSVPTVTGAWTPEQFNTGSPQISNSGFGASNPWGLSAQAANGQVQEASATVEITVVDAQGTELQTATMEVSL